MADMTASPQWVAVGRIRDSHGVNGALKIEAYSVSAHDSVLRHIKRWRLVEPGPAPVAGTAAPGPEVARAPVVPAVRPAARPLSLPLVVRRGRCRVQGDALVAELVLLDGHPPLTREQARMLKGVEIEVDRADFPPAADGEFYHADLIGCEVIGQQDARLGTVVAIDDHGAQQVMRLGDGMLIPFVAAIVLSVDLTGRQIRVDWAADWR